MEINKDEGKSPTPISKATIEKDLKETVDNIPEPPPLPNNYGQVSREIAAYEEHTEKKRNRILYTSLLCLILVVAGIKIWAYSVMMAIVPIGLIIVMIIINQRRMNYLDKKYNLNPKNKN